MPNRGKTMNVKEALRRLKINPNDEEAVKAMIGVYESYIDTQARRFKKNVVGMDEGDMKQEVYLTLLKKVTGIDLRFTDQEIDSYIKTMIRNKMIRLTRESKRELYSVKSIDEVKNTYDDGESISFEQTLKDVNDDVAKNFGDKFFVEKLMEQLSPKAQKIVEIILENEGSIKKIKEALDEYPEFSSSKGVIKRLLNSEIKPVLDKLMTAK